MKIIQATTAADLKTARTLFEEYAAWVEVSLCFQGFDKELANLPGDYVPPRGRLLLAITDDEVAGCIALRPLTEEICEMKRLFVRPQMRGKGFGRQLAEALISEARAIGYKKMRLDTLPDRMARAIEMYRALGFREIESYHQTPYGNVIFMELSL